MNTEDEPQVVSIGETHGVQLSHESTSDEILRAVGILRRCADTLAGRTELTANETIDLAHYVPQWNAA